MPGLKPTISVVVIGRNEGERLRRCLDSVRAMASLPDGHEIIYVDSWSSDSSLQIAAECGAQTIELNAARPGAASARNAGWRVARIRTKSRSFSLASGVRAPESTAAA